MKGKRLIGFIMSVCLIAGVIQPAISLKAEGTTDVMGTGTLPFTEDFGDAEKVASRWNVGSDITINTAGQALLGDKGETYSKVYLTGVSDTDKWSNYIYEAKVTPLSTAIEGGSTHKSAGLVAAVDGNNKGYEFCLFQFMSGANKGYKARLYDRVNATQLALVPYEFTYGDEVTMKMIVKENVIQCYVDDIEIINVTVDNVENLSGSIGMMALGNQALFDDLSVTTQQEPSSLSKSSYIWNGKNVVVSYEDDFSKEQEYNLALGKYAGDTYNLAWDESNKNLKHTASGVGRSFFDGLEDASTLQNYTISADVTPAASSSYAAITSYSSGEVGSDSTTEYDFMITWKNGGKPYARLRYRNGSSSSAIDGAGDVNLGTLFGLTGDKASGVGETFTLRMSTITNTDGSVQLTCYVTYAGVEEQVYDVAAKVNGENTGLTYGTPGIRTQQTGVVYDNIQVTQTVPYTTLYGDKFVDNTGYTAALGKYVGDTYNLAWDESNKNLKHTASGVGRSFFDGIDNASTLQNYTISADVTLAASSSYVAITSYSSGEVGSDSTTEYDFMITWKNGGKPYARLRYRNGSSSSAIDGAGDVNLGTLFGLTGDKASGVGETFTLRMSTITNTDGSVQLTCYVTYAGVEQLVYDVPAKVNGENVALTCGVPGIRTQQTGAVYDNLQVTQTVQDTTLYGDKFVGDTGYTTVLGKYVEDTYNLAWDTEKQNLKYTGTGGAQRSIFDGLGDASTMQNYTISADVTLGAASSYVEVASYASGEVDSDSTSEYAFMIFWKNSKPWARLRYRNGASSSAIDNAGDANLVNLLGLTAEEAVGVGQTFTLRMSTVTNADGSVQLTCYAAHDGTEELVYDVPAKVNGENVALTCGAPGIRTQQAGAVYDNITVEKIIVEAPQPEEPEKESGELPFTEDFEDAEKVVNRWDVGSDITVNAEGQALLGDKGEAYSRVYLTGVSDTDKWSNYVYEAKVTPLSTAIDGGSAHKSAGLVAAVNEDNKGYEFCLFQFTSGANKGYKVRLFDRVNNKQLALESYAFEYDTEVTMKMVVNENVIQCYVDGVEVIKVTVANVEKLSGGIGMMALGNQALFDNLSVAEYVEPEKESGELPFTEDFENAEKIVNRWNIGSKVTMNADGQALLGDQGEALSRVYLTGVLNTDKWSDYVYEAEITPLADKIPNGAVNTSAGIIAAANEKNEGYEFVLLYEVNKKQYRARLYDRANKKELASTSYYFQEEIPLSMKMIVSDNMIQGYIDGELILQTEITGVTELSGTIGMLAGGKQALFDNLSVTKFTGNIKDSLATAPVADTAGIFFYDNFSKGVRVVDNKWADKVLDISDGRLILNGYLGTQYLTGDQGFLLLKDYTVSAKVTLEANEDVSVNYWNSSIVARSTGTSTGYEFAILKSKTSSYIRLYDRTTKTELAKDTSIPIELGKEYLLTMVCEGNVITCYLDNQKVFSVVDNTNTSGTAGVRTVGKGYYDDFVLATPEYAKKFGYISSPGTGDGNDVNVLWYTFLISLFGIALICVWRKREEREEKL